MAICKHEMCVLSKLQSKDFTKAWIEVHEIHLVVVQGKVIIVYLHTIPVFIVPVSNDTGITAKADARTQMASTLIMDLRIDDCYSSRYLDRSEMETLTQDEGGQFLESKWMQQETQRI